MQEKIQQLVHQYSDLVIEYRRDIHENPELGYEEIRTSTKVAEILTNLGIEVERNLSKTGVVGILRGKMPGRTVALRADMDALPLQEQTELSYCSKNDGVMHACGHDMHTAILLGVAHVLATLKDQISGTVKFVFQPAEECNPHGGAKGMIEGGILENPKVDAMLGLHVWPNVLTKKIAIKEGPMMSASDRIFITIKGKSCHGSAPEDGIDACVIGAQVITALQTIVSRNVSPLDSCVITIGKINGGDRYNVIPEKVTIEGTVRTINPTTRKQMPERIEKLIKGVVEGMGGSYEFEYTHGYPITTNDEGITNMVRNSIIKYLGEESLIKVEKPALGGEDFAFYTEKVPSAFMWLGCRPENIPLEDFAPIHNPQFNPDEQALSTGILVMTTAALDFLNNESI